MEAWSVFHHEVITTSCGTFGNVLGWKVCGMESYQQGQSNFLAICATCDEFFILSPKGR